MPGDTEINGFFTKSLIWTVTSGHLTEKATLQFILYDVFGYARRHGFESTLLRSGHIENALTDDIQQKTTPVTEVHPTQEGSLDTKLSAVVARLAFKSDDSEGAFQEANCGADQYLSLPLDSLINLVAFQVLQLDILVLFSRGRTPYSMFERHGTVPFVLYLVPERMWPEMEKLNPLG
ncbi:hypothetical protein EDD85DRAFT_798931 [Armillaria nabsnona]|nr:hypothetical protein EDD85DRAFT_798931 [Armillaria nabsnona]